MPSPFPDDLPLRLVLTSVMDLDHALAIIADRERMHVPLTLGDAEIVARWCDAYADPNTAAETLIATRYRGCRIPAPGWRPAAGDDAMAAERDDLTFGIIVRAAEPEAYAEACRLAGWGWKADWKAANFPGTIAHRARLLANGRRFRVVGR